MIQGMSTNYYLPWQCQSRGMQSHSLRDPYSGALRVVLDKRSTYDELVFCRIVMMVRSPDVQEKLPPMLQGATRHTSPVERLWAHAALGLMSIWKAALFARTISILVGMGADYILKSANNFRRCVRAWVLWWTYVARMEESNAPKVLMCCAEDQYPRVTIPACEVHRSKTLRVCCVTLGCDRHHPFSSRSEWQLLCMPIMRKQRSR